MGTIAAPSGVGSPQDLYYEAASGYVFFSTPPLGALEGFTFDNDCVMHFGQDTGSVVSYFP